MFFKVRHIIVLLCVLCNLLTYTLRTHLTLTLVSMVQGQHPEDGGGKETRLNQAVCNEKIFDDTLPLPESVQLLLTRSKLFNVRWFDQLVTYLKWNVFKVPKSYNKFSG